MHDLALRLATTRSARSEAYVLPPLVALVVAIAAPLVVVYASLYLSAAILRPLSDLGNLGYNVVRLAVSVALCLGPLAVWPFRARSYVVTVGLGLTVLALLNLVHVFEYSQLVTIGAIDAAFSTSGREAGEFLSGRPESTVLALLGSAVAVGVTGWAGLRVPRGTAISRRTRLTTAALGAVGASALIAFPMRLFPVSTVKNAVDYVGYRAQYEAAREARAAHAFGATSTGAWADEEPIVVVIVGESMRRGQLGIYGYDRPTTPVLAGTDDLVLFTDAVSGASVTQPSVKMMMTGATPETVADHAERSWLTLAHEVGFETAWLSNQDWTDGTETALIAEDADRVVYTSHSWSASGQLDEDLLPELDRVLAERDGPLALVVHLMGSHDDYALRYPDRFVRFGPDAPRPASHAGLRADERRMIDYYDNTVAYTDWMLGQILGRLDATGAPAVAVFAADHGENLYDTPARLRGHGVPGTTAYEIEVPLLFWTSPGARDARPDLAETAARNRHRPLSTTDLFYSFADLVGADWPGARPERSVFADDFRPDRRRVALPTGEVVDAAAVATRTVAMR